jgi:hypothetical protein
LEFGGNSGLGEEVKKMKDEREGPRFDPRTGQRSVYSTDGEGEIERK